MKVPFETEETEGLGETHDRGIRLLKVCTKTPTHLSQYFLSTQRIQDRNHYSDDFVFNHIIFLPRRFKFSITKTVTKNGRRQQLRTESKTTGSPQNRKWQVTTKRQTNYWRPSTRPIRLQTYQSYGKMSRKRECSVKAGKSPAQVYFMWKQQSSYCTVPKNLESKECPKRQTHSLVTLLPHPPPPK